MGSTLIDSLTLTDPEQHVHFGEGWFVTDLLGHIGSWLAAANSFLDLIRTRTHRREEIDVDEWNARFLYLAPPGPRGDIADAGGRKEWFDCTDGHCRFEERRGIPLPNASVGPTRASA